VKLAVDLGEADPRPYVRLAARLRKEILNGRLMPGHPVPSITAWILRPVRAGVPLWREPPFRGGVSHLDAVG